MKAALLIIAGILSLVLIFFTFAPEDRVYVVQSEYRRLIGDQGQICFDFHTPQLKDSLSGRLIASHQNGVFLNVDYRAKNGIGVYSDDTLRCPLTNGKFDADKAVKLARLPELDRLIDKFMELQKASSRKFDEEAFSFEVTSDNDAFDAHIAELKRLTDEQDTYLRQIDSLRSESDAIKAELQLQ